MSETRFSTDPELDATLDASRPRTPLADGASDTDVDHLVTVARGEARRGVRHRLPRRGAGVAAVVALGLAGAGVAAAAVTTDDWKWWVQDPDLAFSYTLPSGVMCDDRIGNVWGADPEAVEGAKEFLRDKDVLAMADVENEIEWMRSDREVYGLDQDGNEVRAHYGTPHYKTADQEYVLAVSSAVGKVFEAEIEARDSGAAVESYSGQANCPGADW
jgi:hypothetical protein